MDNDVVKDSHQEFNIRDIVQPYFSRWYWFVISALLGLLAAFFYLKTLTPVYEIVSTVLIKDAKSPGGGGDFSAIRDISGLGKIGSNGVDNEMEIFKSKRLMKSVVKDLGLQTITEVKDRFRSYEVYGKNAPFEIKVLNEKAYNSSTPSVFEVHLEGNKIRLSSEGFKDQITQYGRTVSLPYANIMLVKNSHYQSQKNAPTDFHIVYRSIDNAVDYYLSHLSVSLVNKDATVIRIALNYPETEKAKKIVDKLVENYNIDALEDKNIESKKTADFIEERIAVIGKELGNVETEKQQFKQANQITDLETEAKLGLQTAISAREKQIEIDSQLELTDALLNFVNRQGVYQVLPANVGLQNPSATSNIMQYNQLVLERNRLLENATPQNPVVMDVTKQINSLRSSIVQSLQKNAAGLQMARNNYIAEQNKVSGRMTKIPGQERLFRGIERQQQIKENLYLLLLEKREEAQISLAMSAMKARIVDEAYTDKKVSPKPLIIFGGGLALALLIPFVLIYSKELFDNKIKNKHDVEKLSGGKPVIAELPRLGRGEEQLVQINDLSPLAESFRILITNLNFTLPKKTTGKRIFVTSTVKGEGKTFVSVNLALTMANPKKKTIIIGSDIRNPQLARYNTSRKGLAGLTEYLHDENRQLDSLIQKSSFNPYLDVLYSGTIPPNPTELLSNGRYEVMLQELEKIYDIIIVDTAPLMLVTDTYLISDLADATIYVSRSEYTEKDLIKYASNAMESGKIKNASFVVNDVSKSHFGYGNKYGYGYNAQEKGFFQKLKDKF